MIERYEFGSVWVDGKEYTRDVLIYPGKAAGPARVDATWWRKEGHRLDPQDLKGVVRARPEVVLVGTGYHGCLVVPAETREFLDRLGIELQAVPTREACQQFNQLLGHGESTTGGKDMRRVVAALHLAC